MFERRVTKAVPALLAVAALSLPSLPSGFLDARPFRRGDVDGRAGLSVTDAVRILGFLFTGGPLLPGAQPESDCPDAGDLDDSGRVEVTDAIFLLEYLFRGGPEPTAPFPACGGDLTEDNIGCRFYPSFEICCAVDPGPCGDAVLFVIDRSGSAAGGGGLAIARNEVTRNVMVLSGAAQFGILFFDAGLLRFPASGGPVIASDENKSAAIDFINSVSGGSGSCPREALLSALDLADRSTAPRRAVTYYGDGSGTCPGHVEAEYLGRMLDDVTARNAGCAQISAVGIRVDALGRQTLLSLASANGGTYREIN